MVVIGFDSVVRGVDSVVGAGAGDASLDSEIRFYAAWYVAMGGLLLWAARRPRLETATVRAVCAGFFIAACGRLISLVTVGTPHALAITLMVIEFVVPAVLLPWQRATSAPTVNAAEAVRAPG